MTDAKPNENFLLINKPAGWTSFDAVNFIRKKLRAADPKNKNIKVGHAGTLDPFATGLLVIAAGREATKRLDEFKKLPKTYVAALRLGATSATDDATGEISNFQFPISQQLSITDETIKEVLKKFVGPQTQIPPMYSAKKIAGQRLYKLARAGKTVERPPHTIEIYDIKFLEYAWPVLKIKVRCSAGTYIRTLARDIGTALGTGAYCEELVRTAIGPHELSQAQDLHALDNSAILC